MLRIGMDCRLIMSTQSETSVGKELMNVEAKYCQYCGCELIAKEIGDEGMVPYCNQCNQIFLKSPKPCVIVAVVSLDGEIVLLKQEYVSKTNWVLVAGYIKDGESAEETVLREVLEEIGLQVQSYRYVESYPFVQRGQLMLGYLAMVEKLPLIPSCEVDEIGWFTFDEGEKLLRAGSIAEQHFLQVRKMCKKEEVI
jgi:NAD+ diphosphatase